MIKHDKNMNVLIFGETDDKTTRTVVFLVVRSDTAIGNVEAYLKIKKATVSWVERTFEGNRTYAVSNGVTILDILPYAKDSLVPFLREQGILDLIFVNGHIGEPVSLTRNLTEQAYALHSNLQASG